MLRDRFKAWNLQPKYNKSKTGPNKGSYVKVQRSKVATATQDCELAGPYLDNSLEIIDLLNQTDVCSDHALLAGTGIGGIDYGQPMQKLDIAHGDRTLIKSLRAMQDYYGNLVDKIQRNGFLLGDLDQEQAFEIQRLAANAHQAVGSQVYASHQTFADLQAVGAKAAEVLPALSMNSMHPRVLTVLLRLVVESTHGCIGNLKDQQEVDILRTIKALFKQISTTKLSGDHPVLLLCAMPNDQNQTDQLIQYQMALVKSELYDKIRSHDPRFVALERTYSARVLASLGHTVEAENLLEAAFMDNLVDYDLFVHADACRTLGYTKVRAGVPEEAVLWLKVALEEFQRSGNGETENVLYTYIALSWAYRRLGQLQHCELSLREALNLWRSVENLRRVWSAVKLIRDLDQVFGEQGKYKAQTTLREEFAIYFEDARDQS